MDIFETNNINELKLFLLDFSPDQFISFKYQNIEIVNQFYMGIINNNIVIDSGIHRKLNNKNFINNFDTANNLPTVEEYNLLFEHNHKYYEFNNTYFLSKENDSDNYIIYYMSKTKKQIVKKSKNMDIVLHYNKNDIYYRNITRIPIE